MTKRSVAPFFRLLFKETMKLPSILALTGSLGRRPYNAMATAILKFNSVKYVKRCFSSSLVTEIIHDGLDFISSYVKQFNEEVDAGIAFLTEYQAFIQTKRLRYEFKEKDGKDKYGDELQLSVRGNAFAPESINKYP